jgi:flagellar biosynthesis protein FlhG
MKSQAPNLFGASRAGIPDVGPRLIAVGGGKGGVGKSLVAANLAAALAEEGYRVVAVDTDLPGANLHTCFGVPAPPTSLAEFVMGREDDLGKLVMETSIRNLRLLAATGAHPALGKLRPARRAEFVGALRRLPCDFVVADVAGGTQPEVVDYFLVGDEGLLVMTPEPTSVENAYAFLRAAFYRRLRLAMMSHEVRERIHEALDQRNERGIRTPLDLLREIQAMDPREGARFVRTMRGFRPLLVLNQVRSARDIKLGFSVRSVCRKYFGLDAEYLGYVNHDEAMLQSVVERRPVVEAYPESDAAIYLRRISRKLVETMERSDPRRLRRSS